VTILRDGRRLQTRRSSELNRASILHQMVGEERESAADEKTEALLPVAGNTMPRLAVKNLRQGVRFQNITLDVKPGECLGLYGFVGAGHQELVHALAGALPIDVGEITLDGHRMRTGDVPSAVSKGVVLVAADRAQTLARRASIAHNATLAHLKRSVGSWITGRKELSVCQPLLERVGCRPPNPKLRAGALSGGNQQKVVLAKWLLGPIHVLLLEEPTRGMDVHAKAEVMELIAQQKRNGAAIILATTEPELVLAHADRIVTFARGRITREFSGQRVTKQDLMHCAEESSSN
jgi:ribose transport system ATP-binding protein